MGILKKIPLLFLILLVAACGGAHLSSDGKNPDPLPLPSPSPSSSPDTGNPQSDNPPNTDTTDLSIPPTTTDDPENTATDEGTVAPPDTTPPDTAPPDTTPPDTTPPDTNTTPPPAPRIVSFTSTASCVAPGDRVTFNWETQNADRVTLDGTTVAAKGTRSFSINSQTTHTLQATSAGQARERVLTVYLKMLETFNTVMTEPLPIDPVDDLKASSDGTLLILSDGKIYKGKRGDDFARLSPRSTASGWSALAIDPDNSDILYAARTGRIYRSHDGGTSWPDVIPVRRNNRDLNINTMNTEAGNRLYIGFEGGAFKLDISGTPSLTLMTGLNTENILILSQSGTRVLASDGSAVFSSANTGTSWAPLANPAWGEIHSLEIHSGIFYVGTGDGLYQSSNGSWQKILPHPVYQTKFISEGNTEVLYAATSDGVFKKGTTWENIIPQETHFVFEDDGFRAASAGNFLGLTEQTRYSDFCPLQLVDVMAAYFRPQIRLHTEILVF